MNRLLKSALITIALFLTIQLSYGAVYIVTDSGDSGAGTLRELVGTANSTTGIDDIIRFQPGLGPVILTGSTIAISDRIRIDGTGQTITGTGVVALQLSPSRDGSSYFSLIN